MSAVIQSFSHYPAWPVPQDVPTFDDGGSPCPYLPGRKSRLRVIVAGQIDPDVYHNFMDSGFRRSGLIVYQPVCQGCRQCVPIRVLADQFRPSRSQRRCLTRNRDLQVRIDRPGPTDEKYALYTRYMREWHGEGPDNDSREGFERFLYQSPVDTIEWTYRDGTGRLLAVGIGDISARSLSSVYFFFDPEESRRGLGTFGALRELDYCRDLSTPLYYLGYWINGCRTMKYKAHFRPCEVLYTDGIWRPLNIAADVHHA